MIEESGESGVLSVRSIDGFDNRRRRHAISEHKPLINATLQIACHDDFIGRMNGNRHKGGMLDEKQEEKQRRVSARDGRSDCCTRTNGYSRRQLGSSHDCKALPGSLR